MIATDLSRYVELKKAEHLHDIYQQDDAAQRCHNQAHFLAVSIRSRVNAMLKAEGVTLADLEQAELS